MKFTIRLAAGSMMIVATQLLTPAVQAAVTQYEWTGRVTDPGKTVSGVEVGSPISGRFFYDNEAVGSDGVFPHAITNHSVTVGGFSGIFAEHQVRLFDDTSSVGDQLDTRNILSNYSGDTPNNVTPNQLFLRLNDFSAMALSDVTVLPFGLDLSDWPDTNAEGQGIDSFIGNWNLFFRIETLSPVADVPTIACHGFLPPFDRVLTLKKNTKRVIPVELELTDEDGFTVTDVDLLAPPVIDVSFNGLTIGTASPDTEDLLPVGAANKDNIFRFDPETGKWIYNLGSKQFAASGAYRVTALSGDSSEYRLAGENGACSQTFERLP